MAGMNQSPNDCDYMLPWRTDQNYCKKFFYRLLLYTAYLQNVQDDHVISRNKKNIMFTQ